jgi:hypothetical protein
MENRRLCSALLCLLVTIWLSIVPVEAAVQNLPRPANPFADPKHDPYNPLKYIASNVLTGIAFCTYYIKPGWPASLLNIVTIAQP